MSPRISLRLAIAALALVPLSTGCLGGHHHARFGVVTDGGMSYGDGGPQSDSGFVPPGDASVYHADAGDVFPSDAGSGCPSGYEDCGSGCVDVTSSVYDCGYCGNACGAGDTCVDGSCTSSCPSGTEYCSGSCADVSSDSNNCGYCGNVCPTGETCSGGACNIACPEGSTYCSGTCVDTLSDSSNCGTCGFTCPTGQMCNNGTCMPGSSGAAGNTCATGDVFPAGGGSMTFTWAGDTAVHTPFSCGTTSANPDHAFRWTPYTSGSATIHAMGPTTSTDTVMAVFSASDCTRTDQIACNDDTVSGSLDSTVTLTVTAGTTYYIDVAPYSTTTPTDTITVTITAP